MSRFRCVDLFCGGGGTSTGMIEAFRKAGDECSLVGINHWRAAAMSFPSTYRFSGTKTEQIRQIGNAVCPRLAEALVSAALSA